MTNNILNIDKLTLENDKYSLKVLSTTENSQLIIQNIRRFEVIILESDNQFVKIVEGLAKLKVNNRIFKLQKGSSILLKPGEKYELIPVQNVKFYTTISPPIFKKDFFTLINA